MTIRIVLATLALLCLTSAAAAQHDHRHPPQDARAHETYYYYLTRPDVPNSLPGSCCGSGDCYAAPARFVGDHWEALRREDQVWIEIPNERIVTREDQLARRPTYEATLCATRNFTYCFVRPEGGM